MRAEQKMLEEVVNLVFQCVPVVFKNSSSPIKGAPMMKNYHYQAEAEAEEEAGMEMTTPSPTLPLFPVMPRMTLNSSP